MFTCIMLFPTWRCINCNPIGIVVVNNFSVIIRRRKYTSNIIKHGNSFRLEKHNFVTVFQ